MEDRGGCNKGGCCPPSPCNGHYYGTREGEGAMPGQRNANPRFDIDTSPPFGSVKEAVDHFEGNGFCLPFNLPLGIRHDHENGGVDLKTAEERTLELEKNLIMKELETLDVLEELGTTKRIVEELKWQLQKDALKCMAAVPEPDERVIQSQDLILVELNQAKSNLGKTIGELEMIKTSVESLSKRIMREKEVLERTRLRLTSKCMTRINTAEMKLVAARKMEEAARAAEAVAMAEIRALSRDEVSFNISMQEPENPSSFLQGPLSRTPCRNVEEAPTQNNKGGKSNASRSGILKKLEDATEEVKLSQQALEVALSRVEIANKKQVAAGEALRRWMPKRGDRRKNPNLSNPIFPSDGQARSPAHNLVVRTNISDDEPRPILRTTVSMRDVLGRKQVLQTEGRRVALSQMLNELREDLRLPTAKEADESRDQGRKQQFLAQRKKFGFIHISFPLMKQSKKNGHASELQ